MRPIILFLVLLALQGCAFNVKNLPSPKLEQIRPIRGGTLSLKISSPSSAYADALQQALTLSGTFVSVTRSNKIAPTGYTLEVDHIIYQGRDPIGRSALYGMFRMLFSILIPLERTDSIQDKAKIYYNGIPIGEHRISYDREFRYSMNPAWMLTGKPTPEIIDRHAANQFAGSLLVKITQAAGELQ